VDPVKEELMKNQFPKKSVIDQLVCRRQNSFTAVIHEYVPTTLLCI